MNNATNSKNPTLVHFPKCNRIYVVPKNWWERIEHIEFDEESKDSPINESTNNKHLIGDYVIVRCRDAGVHAGVLENYEGREVILKESRRLWYFKCKTGHTLSGVALHGVNDESKIAGEVSKIILSEACEIIPVSKDAERSIRDAKEYNT